MYCDQSGVESTDEGIVETNCRDNGVKPQPDEYSITCSIRR